MIPDETFAYALGAWKRFDQDVTDGLLRAVAGAFVLVAASDGELSPSEANRFLETLGSKADSLSLHKHCVEPGEVQVASDHGNELLAFVLDDLGRAGS